MWRNQNVWIVLLGEFIAGLGLWTAIVANLEFMQKYIPSDFMKSLVLFVGLLAGVLIGPYAGKVIDTSKKKTVLLYSGAGRAISVCFMLLALNYESITWMILFTILLQISAAFYFPALQAIIPIIVEEKQLLSMNGVHMNVSTIARILGTALAGVLLTVMSLYSLYIISFILYLFLLASTWFLRVDEKNEKKTEGEHKQGKQSKGFAEIIPVLKSLPQATMVLMLTIIPSLFIGGFNLMVINISELQADATLKGLLYTVEGTCFILAALLVPKISKFWNTNRLVIFFAAIISVSQLSLYFSNRSILPLLSFGLFGLGAGFFFPIVSTIFQTQIPKEFHGRFFSFRNMFDRVLFQVVLLGTGLMLDTIGLQYMVLWIGGFSLILVVTFIFWPKYFQQPIVNNRIES